MVLFYNYIFGKTKVIAILKPEAYDFPQDCIRRNDHTLCISIVRLYCDRIESHDRTDSFWAAHMFFIHKERNNMLEARIYVGLCEDLDPEQD